MIADKMNEIRENYSFLLGQVSNILRFFASPLA
jgi:hypothetical protein